MIDRSKQVKFLQRSIKRNQIRSKTRSAKQWTAGDEFIETCKS